MTARRSWFYLPLFFIFILYFLYWIYIYFH